MNDTPPQHSDSSLNFEKCGVNATVASLSGKPVKNTTCKICNSEKYREAIANDIIEGLSPSEIVEKYPDLNLTWQHVVAHINHMNVLPEGVELYLEQRNSNVVQVVNEIHALDQSYSKCYNFIMDANFDKIAPRKLEVVGDLMLKSIQLKAELIGNSRSAGDEIVTLLAKAIEKQKIITVNDDGSDGGRY